MVRTPGFHPGNRGFDPHWGHFCCKIIFVQILSFLFDFILHVDRYIEIIFLNYGQLAYFIIFFIIFAETGFVVTPFLPGDSLLFASGSFSSLGFFDIYKLLPTIYLAAVMGDSLNYFVGRFVGLRISKNPSMFLVKEEYLKRAYSFYKVHGPKTVFMARFVPILRTFAPFVAGVSKMKYIQFLKYSLSGSLVWVFGFILLGYYFGNIPAVKDNFKLVIFAIIFVSLIPLLYETAKRIIKK